MVRDAYSAGAQPQQADDDDTAQPLDLRGNAANLTQELSLLLAQSIQGQAGKRPPNAVSAGSELANLAALVSASQSQRNLQPSFRDGLSSLSYNRPAQAPIPSPPPVPAQVPPTPPSLPPMGGGLPSMGGGLPSMGGGLPSMGSIPSSGSLLVSEPHDEEPMPIPSTWRQPMPNDDERWYRQQLGAAGLGLLAGLVVVVPAVLWLSGWIGGAPSKPALARQVAETAPPARVELPQVKVRINSASAEPRMPSAEPRYPTAPIPEQRITVAAAPPVEPTPAPRTRAIAAEPPAAMPVPRAEPTPVRSRADDLLIQARRLIDSRDIVGARELLQTTETTASAPLTFMLAETYDPSMLAIWQVKPDGVSANPERARALYQRARDLGDARAQQRLDWLR